MLDSKRLYVVNALNGMMPPSRLFGLRRRLYRWAGAELGEGVRIMSSAKIWGTGRLVIGADTFVGHESSIIVGGSEVHIGSRVDISSGVMIINGSHHAWDTPGKAAGTGYSSPVALGDGCWIGARATIIGGSDVGAEAIVGAGAVVTGSLEPATAYVGAKVRPLPRKDRPPAEG